MQGKLELITTNYMDLLSTNPDLAIFVLSEMKNSEGGLLKQMPVRQILRESVFVRQLQEKRPDISPLHFIVNLMGMIIFPFIVRPVFKATGALDDEIFRKMMEERKKLIPNWIKLMLDTK